MAAIRDLPSLSISYVMFCGRGNPWREWSKEKPRQVFTYLADVTNNVDSMDSFVRRREKHDQLL